jgi:parvulin-like peptidyl-prolyl isomerase
MDAAFEEAAFGVRPGTLSGIVESAYGYHLIFVEAKKPAGTEPFDAVQGDLREMLIAQQTTAVVDSLKRLTNELRASSKIATFPENIE